MFGLLTTNRFKKVKNMSFLGFREHLETLLYPGISVLKDEDIEKVFGPENRQFLLKWIFQKMHHEYLTMLGYSDNIENALVQLMQENGFCKPSQKTLFVKGDLRLSKNEQYDIFKKMFNHLMVASGKNSDEDITFDDCFKSFEKILDEDLILFPNNRLLTSKYTNNKIYENESIDINENEFVDGDINVTLNIPDLNVLQQGDKLLSNFHVIKSESKKLEKIPISTLSPIVESDTVIPSCSKNVKQLLEYTRSVDVISESEKLTCLSFPSPNKNCNDMVNELLLLSYKLKL